MDNEGSIPGYAKLATLGRPVTLVDLKPRSDLTYRLISDLTVEDANVFQSLFTGSILRQSTWRHVRFERSDLDGLRGEGSLFQACHFGTCDIRSSQFAGCTFEACCLDDAFIDDCEFTDCSFVDCTFRGAATTSSRFTGCELISCNLSPGTFLHNRLYSCRVTRTVLGDCTLLYLILRDCKLTDVKLNAESVGGVFGLTPEMIAGVELVYLGRDQPVSNRADLVQQLLYQYEQRHWAIGQLVHEINFGLAPVLDSFARYLTTARERFLEMGFAKGDELRFLSDVLEELVARGSLPMLVVLDTLEWCNSLQSQLQLVSSQPADEAVRQLGGRMSALSMTMLQALEDRLDDVPWS